MATKSSAARAPSPRPPRAKGIDASALAAARAEARVRIMRRQIVGRAAAVLSALHRAQRLAMDLAETIMNADPSLLPSCEAVDLIVQHHAADVAAGAAKPDARYDEIMTTTSPSALAAATVEATVSPILDAITASMRLKSALLDRLQPPWELRHPDDETANVLRERGGEQWAIARALVGAARNDDRGVDAKRKHVQRTWAGDAPPPGTLDDLVRNFDRRFGTEAERAEMDRERARADAEWVRGLVADFGATEDEARACLEDPQVLETILARLAARTA